MNKIEPVEIGGLPMNKPYGVKLNGHFLRDSRDRVRRFRDSITAAVAGAKEVDRRRATP